jgi:hypothetical protein
VRGETAGGKGDYMWYSTELNELINLDNVVSLRVHEEIQDGAPKAYWVVALMQTGLHHMDLKKCKTPEEAKGILQALQDLLIANGYKVIGPILKPNMIPDGTF